MTMAAEATQKSMEFKSMREAYELIYGEIPEYKAKLTNSYLIWLQGGQNKAKTDSV